MKNLLFAFTLIITFSYQAQTQDLPAAWRYSEDGRRLIAGGENQGGFFNPTQIQEVQLSFSQANWWNLLEANYSSGTDLLATCWINGIQYDSVGVRFKGATSYRRNNTDKKSFNITLDYIIDGQDIDGYNTFNLNCGWEDNSSMKEVLYNSLGYNYYMGLKSNYVNLTINGQYWGPYQNVQQFDSDYIKEWYLSNDGTIWRAERTAGTTGGGGGGRPNFGAGRSSLNYNGPDSSDYNTDYTLKRTEQADPWAGLIAACDVLNNEPLISLEEELSKVFDIDKACWYLAHEVVFSDDDSYINKGGSDYYVYYEAETGRIIPMEYDGNSVLGGNNLNWDLFFKENDADFPLMNRLLAVPAIRQRYLAHVRVILADYFTSTYADPLIDDWAAMIDSSIQADPKKFYTYAEHQSAINSLKQSIQTRRNFLLNDAELSNVNPLSIASLSYSVNGQNWQAPTSSEEVDVHASVSGSSGVSSVWLYFGEGLTGAFEKVEMFDDGLHNDGAALDGQFGARIPANNLGAYVRFYVEAIANDAALTRTYEPKGAEHDVYIYQVLTETAAEQSIVINELMSQNDAAVADSTGEYDDWLELYNTSGVSVDLSGWTLSDDINELDKYVFPAGTSLGADSYLVIWADEDLDQGIFHADFKLSADGESLYLSNSNQELVDEVNFPASDPDLAYARIPNGSGPFRFQAASLGQFNGSANSSPEVETDVEFKMYPNPASDFLRIEFEASSLEVYALKILNLQGELLYEKEIVSGEFVLPLAGFAQGMYIIQLEVENATLAKKFIKE